MELGCYLGMFVDYVCKDRVANDPVVISVKAAFKTWNPFGEKEGEDDGN